MEDGADLTCCAQAFLETEPGTRATTEEYMMRYQKFARDDLNKALKKHQDLLDQVGEPACRRVFMLVKTYELTSNPEAVL